MREVNMENLNETTSTNNDVIIINKLFSDLTKEEREKIKDKLVLKVKISQNGDGKAAIDITAESFDNFTNLVFVEYWDEKSCNYKYRVRKWDETKEAYESGEDGILRNSAVFYCKKSEVMEKLKEIINEIKENREKARTSKLEVKYLTVLV